MTELEPRKDGISNTITTVQKDNLLIEQHDLAVVEKVIENIPCKLDKVSNGTNGKFSSLQDATVKNINCDIASTITERYYKGICADNDNICIVTMRGRNPDNPSDRAAGSPTEQRLEPNRQGICNTLTSVQKDNMVLENVCINDRGFTEKEPQISIGTAPTLRAETHGNLPKVIENQYRIRKLTPLECWRLMGFSDEDFRKSEEVNSNTQLYKQAGNSIVKNVLMAIFGQMIPGKENIYKEL